MSSFQGEGGVTVMLKINKFAKHVSNYMYIPHLAAAPVML
jgi:hypothetical protein